ncbi:hypothetical protein G6F45_013886 [Rhizopus arrhizus]|nr:hypothetical protein G6F45_013886 [Rhizopus arrhizus]
MVSSLSPSGPPGPSGSGSSGSGLGLPFVKSNICLTWPKSIPKCSVTDGVPPSVLSSMLRIRHRQDTSVSHYTMKTYCVIS